MKLVEKSGRPLSKFFNKNISTGKCHREDCVPCSNPKIRGSSMCMAKGVVYEGVCVMCDSKHRSSSSETHRGMYIGQTSRSLYERCLEHMASYKRFDFGSFMFKHWAICHKDSPTPPKFEFRVVQCQKEPLTRLIHEAVKILSHASMNSKTEHVGYKIPRLVVDKSARDAQTEIDNEVKVTEWENDEMVALKVIALAQPNVHLDYRKRKGTKMFQGAECEISPVTKKTRSDGPTDAVAVPESASDTVPASDAPNRVSSGRGKWNPSRRNFSAKKTQVEGAHSVLRWLKSMPKSSTPVKVSEVIKSPSIGASNVPVACVTNGDVSGSSVPDATSKSGLLDAAVDSSVKSNGSCEALVKGFEDESTTSSLMYNLDSFYGFKKEASGLTLESSSFLKHVLDISQKEGAQVAPSVQLSADVSVQELASDGADGVHVQELTSNGIQRCDASWHQGKSALSKVSHEYLSNSVKPKVPLSLSGAMDASAEAMSVCASDVSAHSDVSMRSAVDLPGCLCLIDEVCCFCSHNVPASSENCAADYPDYQRDLWAHLCRIKMESFRRCSAPAKRKDAEPSFSHNVSQCPMDSLTVSLKKMKVQEQEVAVGSLLESRSLLFSGPRNDDPSLSFEKGEPCLSSLSSRNLSRHSPAIYKHAQYLVAAVFG